MANGPTDQMIGLLASGLIVFILGLWWRYSVLQQYRQSLAYFGTPYMSTFTSTSIRVPVCRGVQLYLSEGWMKMSLSVVMIIWFFIGSLYFDDGGESLHQLQHIHMIIFVFLFITGLMDVLNKINQYPQGFVHSMNLMNFVMAAFGFAAHLYTTGHKNSFNSIIEFKSVRTFINHQMHVLLLYTVAAIVAVTLFLEIIQRKNILWGLCRCGTTIATALSYWVTLLGVIFRFYFESCDPAYLNHLQWVYLYVFVVTMVTLFIIAMATIAIAPHGQDQLSHNNDGQLPQNGVSPVLNCFT